MSLPPGLWKKPASRFALETATRTKSKSCVQMMVGRDAKSLASLTLQCSDVKVSQHLKLVLQSQLLQHLAHCAPAVKPIAVAPGLGSGLMLLSLV